MMRKLVIHSVFLVAIITTEVFLRTYVLSFVSGVLFFKTVTVLKEYLINRASRNMWVKFQVGLKTDNINPKTKTK